MCFIETVIILSWERNLLALHDLGDVQIEEIAVENGLFVGGVKILFPKNI